MLICHRRLNLSSKIEEVKLAGSKRFGLFWAILLLFFGLWSMQDGRMKGIISAVVVVVLLFKSIGDLRRMGMLLTILFFVGSIIGTIIWSWWAVPLSLIVVFAMAATHGRWITQPLLRLMRSTSPFGSETVDGNNFGEIEQ